MTEPSRSPELISVGAQVLAETARRLGITWQISPATVSVDNSDGTVQAIFDGDSEAITMMSLVGTLIAGQRVMGLVVPPANNYVLAIIGSDEWVDYPTAWTAATTPPSIGNGQLISRYRARGTSIDFRIAMQAGTTTTFGTGAWSFTLPFATFNDEEQTATAFANDTSAGGRCPGAVRISPGSTSILRVSCVAVAGGTGDVTNVFPFAWATGDELLIQGVYERAR